MWHFARPCGHRSSPASSRRVKYNGGPLWTTGYTWQSVYWGSYFATQSSSSWVKRVEDAVLNIETDKSYSGGLSEYNVGIGRIIPHAIIKTSPPGRLSDSQIRQNTVNNAKGPFYTVEPYPCTQGCNHCTTDPFDTLSQGLSEEMVELKTDMDPGTGWVIGNEELCDYCDAKFVCNRISTGEYVNAWYDKGKNACWKAPARQGSELFPTDLDANRSRVETGS